MPRKAHLVLAVLACLAACGCGAKVTYKYKIAVIPKGLTHEHWQSVKRGADRAAADLQSEGLAVQVLWDGPNKESEVREQINLVQVMVNSRGVNGVVLAPQDSKKLVSVVEETTGKGIPVVVIDSDLDNRDLYVKYVATNNYNGGKMAARRLLAVLEKAGKPAPKLVLFRYSEGSESTEQREQGFLDHIKKVRQARKGKPGPEVIADSDYAGATVDSAQAVAGPMLGRIKDEADGIFAVNESATTGLLLAMRSQKLNQKIRLVGFDSSEALQQAVEEGDVDGLIIQDPYRMGYLSLWILVQHLEGYDVSAGDKTLYTGEYLLTNDNLKKDSTRQLFDRALQVKRTLDLPKFKKMK
jgi:ribose transport system substrate-binding protein